MATGGDGEGFCADGAAAGDVVRGIADDPDPFGRERDARMFAGAAEGVGAEVVAMLAVVGEGAEREEIPEAVVGEFDAGGTADVAGEEGLGDVGPGGGGSEEGWHAGENRGTGMMELGRKAREVAVEVAEEIFFGIGYAVADEDLAEDDAVGAAGEVDICEVGGDAEEFKQRRAQGADAGAGRGDKGAVDIPEQESFHVKQNVRRGVTGLRIRNERLNVSTV